MAEDDQGDRTEAASPRKREEARKAGQFARSPDLSAAAVLCAALIGLSAFGGTMFVGEISFMKQWIGHLDGKSDILKILTNQFPTGAAAVSWGLLGMLLIVELAALGIGIAQCGLHIHEDIIPLRFESLNPINGFKRIFSLQTLVSTAMGLAKIAVISIFAYRIIRALIEAAPFWWQSPLGNLFAMGSALASQLAWSIAIPMLLLGVIDYGYKWWKTEKDLMMTKDEVKQENKQNDGDPHVKNRIRQIQRSRAARRMMKDVPKATVVITNPTHVAVALLYDAKSSGAPVVIAKGEHLMAQRIKQIAREHNIPVMEEPPLARALNRTTEIGQEIPVEFYRAVAAILALLHRAKNAARGLAGRQS